MTNSQTLVRRLGVGILILDDSLFQDLDEDYPEIVQAAGVLKEYPYS